jgi:hypothetical protein
MSCPAFAQTTAAEVLDVDSVEYSHCDGTYSVHGDKGIVLAYYVNGEQSTLEEYVGAISNVVKPKTIDERVAELEQRTSAVEEKATLAEDNITAIADASSVELLKPIKK